MGTKDLKKALVRASTSPKKHHFYGKGRCDMTTVSAKGTVKWFDKKTGHGFIIRDNGREIFFEKRYLSENILDKIKEGVQVTFNLVADGKRPTAKDVHLL